MDMWEPYIASVREDLPGAETKIVFDKFHIAKHLGEAVDRVRRREQKTLKAAGDDRLTGTRYDWLRHPVAMEPKDRREFAVLRNSGLKTARAWVLKETAMASRCSLRRCGEVLQNTIQGSRNPLTRHLTTLPATRQMLSTGFVKVCTNWTDTRPRPEVRIRISSQLSAFYVSLCTTV
jgi:hypothetical protein